MKETSWAKGNIDVLSIRGQNVKEDASENELSLEVSRLFDPSNIVSSEPQFIRKKMCYTGHASTTYSVEQAIAIIDYIGQQADSEDFLPYAITLVENNELIASAEDNGEFSCGNILASCLQKLDGYNVLVCVSRYVYIA